MKTTKKSVFDFIESHDETLFVYVKMRSIKTESELMQILQKNEADIISGKCAKKRSVIHKSSSKITFSDGSSLWKTEKVNSYTFKTEKLTYYVCEIVTEWEGDASHTFMCYAA